MMMMIGRCATTYHSVGWLMVLLLPLLLAMVLVSSADALLSPLPHRHSSQLHVHVATDFLLGTMIDTSAQSQASKQHYQERQQRNEKLSRPERKALERQRKHRRATTTTTTTTTSSKRTTTTTTTTTSSKEQQEGVKYNLHSTAVSQLTEESTADEVLRAIKRAQKNHDHHDIRVIEDFLLDCHECFAYGYRGSLLARLAVAALHLGHQEVARKAIEVRRRDHRSGMLPMESAAIIRGLLRNHNVTDALEMLQDELSIPIPVRYVLCVLSSWDDIPITTILLNCKILYFCLFPIGVDI